jgi:hypothetical protein
MPAAEREAGIPKRDGRQRPLGIAAFEDKNVQRANVAVLNAIYDEDFLGFLYGFRPKRSQHDALVGLVVGIGRTKVNYILDAEIRSFFDEVVSGCGPGYALNRTLSARETFDPFTMLFSVAGHIGPIDGISRAISPSICPLGDRVREVLFCPPQPPTGCTPQARSASGDRR